MNKKEKNKALKGAVWTGARTKDGKKIMFASEQEVQRLAKYVEKVLKVFGHPEAWVSDLSSVADFLCCFSTEKEQSAKLRKFAKAFGFEVEMSDLVWKVAERLQKAEKDGRSRPTTKASNRPKKRS